MERLLACGSLVKPMPDTEPVMVKKPTSPTVAAVQPRMSVDEKRAATHKHREQLAMLNKKEESVQHPRRAFVDKRPDVGKAPVNVWNKPVFREPEKTVADTSPVSSGANSPKPVLKCTPAMAVEMLREMAKAGIATESVVIEIIGAN
jgi:hypothetical protein